MKTPLSLGLALAGVGILSGTADAASTTFGGVATLRAGYGNNTSLTTSTQTASSAIVGGDLSATLSRIAGNGRTALTGNADLTQGFNGNGRTENYTVQLNHSQQLNPRLQMSGDIIYLDSFNPAPNYSTDARDLLPIGDILTLGTHSRQINGDLNGGYQLSSKDLIQFGILGGRTTYVTQGASAYTQYGGNLGYLRTISSATRIGVQASWTRVLSDLYSNSSSGSLGLQLTQRINRRWTFAGGINGVLQRNNGSSFKTIGFNASLCGDYTRLTVCVLGSRQSAASGIGGLRIDTQGGARVNYKLTALSSIDFETTYDVTSSQNNTLAKQRYVDAALTYRRTITQRLSAGFSGRYQKRMIDTLGPFVGGHSNGYTATADVSYQFGRTS